MSAHVASIEVDPSLAEDGGSDYSTSGYNTDTTSLSSSVHEYIFENGRRYHAYYGIEKNLMPTDETEQDRMDLAHEIVLRLLDGELHKSQLSNPQRILDLGTGTGLWAIDAADKYPSAEVIGVDLSPIQPKWVPPNCRFEVDDAELDWMYQPESFDFIHIRNLSQGVSNWPKVLGEAYRCLKPGGAIELSETGVIFRSDDGTMKPDNPAKIWSNHLEKAMIKAGRPALQPGDLRKRLENAGYAQINDYVLKQPFGPWAKDKKMKELGVMLLLISEMGFHSYGTAAFTRVLGMSAEKAETLSNEAIAAVKNKNSHMYIDHYVATARKPL